MPTPGSKLGRFEILELLGAGGMGEVYRAYDPRLKRNVALKLLPANFMRDPERKARFEREAQVLASLSHPNIAALYEIVPVHNSQVLVMELVEGETLVDCIAEGPMPLEEALGIAAQIAAALEAAHEKDIVHRDLKPGNVKLRPDGTVKLLDFGLAKVSDQVLRTGNAADVTLTSLEMPGAAAERILGSPACMSPEQARGFPVDNRSDVWAFGCLLYEMLSGKRAFAGETTAEVIAKILEREPDYSLLPPELPSTIPRLLRRCMEKDRRRRLRDIGDARIELLDALDHAAVEPTATGPLTARASALRLAPTGGRLLGGAAIAILAVLAIWLLFPSGAAPVSQQVTRFLITEPSLQGSGISISPDGSRVAYISGRGLILRELNRLDSTVLIASSDVQGNPFFSPDGHWLAFRGGDSLRKVPVTGGTATTLVERPVPAGTWSGDDIIFGEPRGLFRVPAAGGKPVELLAIRDVEQIVSVEVLRDRQAVLFTTIPVRVTEPDVAGSLSDARIEALDLRTGEHHVVLRGGGRSRYTRTGHLLFTNDGTLYAVKFDREHLQTQGNPVPLIETAGLIDFSVSAQGTLIYQVVQPAAPELVIVLNWFEELRRLAPID